MTASVLPQFLATPRGRLFSVLHQPAGAPRALLLVCPPFLHEYARSYRLFSLLGDALANADIAVLRFDYLGTGDSDGDDQQFTLEGTCVDAALAADELQRRWPGAALSIMGVRAGSHPALQTAATHPVHQCILWQPVLDWARYLQQLEQLDAEQRLTVPGLTKGDVSASLMGFRCAAELRGSLAGHRMPAPLAFDPARLLVLSDQPSVPPLETSAFMSLPPSLSQWVGEVDMAAFPSRPVRELAGQLAAHLLAATGTRQP